MKAVLPGSVKLTSGVSTPRKRTVVAEGETSLDGAEWADISYPGFFAAVARSTGGAVSPP
jgi:hypothetical protein